MGLVFVAEQNFASCLFVCLLFVCLCSLSLGGVCKQGLFANCLFVVCLLEYLASTYPWYILAPHSGEAKNPSFLPLETGWLAAQFLSSY